MRALVRINVSYACSWAQAGGRLTLLINSAQSGPPCFTVRQLLLSRTVLPISEFNTGGERRFSSRGGFTWGFDISGRNKSPLSARFWTELTVISFPECAGLGLIYLRVGIFRRKVRTALNGVFLLFLRVYEV